MLRRMRRRVTSSLRRALATIGLLMLVWTPISYFVEAWVSYPWSRASVSLAVWSGHFDGKLISLDAPREVPARPIARFRHDPDMCEFWEWPLYPRLHRTSMSSSKGTITSCWIPLWLPALLCLAWPVTHFLLARRRRRRGFPVEPRSAAAVRGDGPGTEAPTGRAEP